LTVRVFDAHFHVIDERFPLVANQGYVPEPFTVEDYRERLAGLGVEGGAVVSGSFQAYDQSYLLDALRRLGPGFVGVTQVPETVTDEQVLALAAAGVRAFRVNANRGASLDGVERLAARLYELAGWHLEVSAPDLTAIPPVPRLVIDHLGLTDQLPELLRRVEAGAHVKASGFGRLDFDVPATLRAIAAVNPGALVFGTDLPGTRAPRPFVDGDVQLVHEHAGMDAVRRNAAALYRL
jgi:predicted TIM-barrel fold metal-dependent hydrolase